MLVSDVADYVRDSIGDRSGIFTTDSSIIFWCNEAVDDIYRKTDLGFTTSATVNFTSVKKTESIADLLRIYSAHNLETDRALEEKTLDSIVEMHGVRYISSGESPKYYYTHLVNGVKSFTVVPTPTRDINVEVFYTVKPAEFTATSDNLDAALPANFQHDVVRFCIMRAHEKEKDFRASEKAQEHYNYNLVDRRHEAHKLDDSFVSIDADPLDYI